MNITPILTNLEREEVKVDHKMNIFKKLFRILNSEYFKEILIIFLISVCIALLMTDETIYAR